MMRSLPAREGLRSTHVGRRLNPQGQSEVQKSIHQTAKRSNASPPPATKIDLPSQDCERRQLTVMFCDIAGSTALGASLDPEDLRQLIDGAHKRWEEIIKRHDGFVARYMGDGVLAYFGYPAGHEDNAERAAHAALEIVELTTRPAAGASRPDYDFAIRVGIATGLAVVGGSIGEGASREMPAFGLTPNLAARLQDIAPPNSVLIAAATRNLIGSKFECEEYEPHQLKGLPEPVPVWRLVRACPFPSLYTARHSGARRFTVGRDLEQELLCRQWSHVAKHKSQVVLLSGEPGIGKSHLCEAFIRGVAQPFCAVLRYQCTSVHTNTALHSVIEEIELSAGIGREDDTAVRLGKLETLLGAFAGDIDDFLPAFAALLSLPAKKRYPRSEANRQNARTDIISGLVKRLLLLSQREPVVVLIEDAQWIDPSTQEFLKAAIEQVRSARVLILITARAGFEAGWLTGPHVTSHVLTPLTRGHSAELVRLIADGGALPEDTLAAIIERTGGVPFFVEELTKWILGSGTRAVHGDSILHDAASSPTTVPTRLHDFLISQLDRLGMAKPVAQLGAIIGRMFPFWLLARLWPFDEETLRASLAEVIAAGLVVQRQDTAEESYMFRHELIRDAAYESLLRAKRRSLHLRIAQIATDEHASSSGTRPELIAYHYSAAGMNAKAAPYWLEAGQLALRESANREARASLQNGLQCLADVPESLERKQLEIRLLGCLGQASIAILGHASHEVHDAFSRAHQLCLTMDDAPELFPVVWGITAHHLVKGDIRHHLELSAKLMEIAESSGNSDQLVVAHTSRTLSHYFSGEFTSARRHLEEVRTRYDWERHRHLTYSYAVDRKMIALQFGTWVLWKLGYPDQAAELEEELNDHARRIAHPNSLAQALTAGASVYMLRREPDRLLERVREGVAIAEAHGYPVWTDHADFWVGWAYAEKGDVHQGIRHLRRALVAYSTHGAGSSTPKFLGLLADSLGEVGCHEEGLALLDQAIGHIEQTGERATEAEIYRLRGKLLFARNRDDAEADANLRKAVDIARAQKAKAWELRAATTLGRVLLHRNQRQQARACLAPVYDWYQEGLETPDLRDAQALLHEIS